MRDLRQIPRQPLPNQFPFPTGASVTTHENVRERQPGGAGIVLQAEAMMFDVPMTFRSGKFYETMGGRRAYVGTILNIPNGVKLSETLYPLVGFLRWDDGTWVQCEWTEMGEWFAGIVDENDLNPLH